MTFSIGLLAIAYIANSLLFVARASMTLKTMLGAALTTMQLGPLSLLRAFLSFAFWSRCNLVTPGLCEPRFTSQQALLKAPRKMMVLSALSNFTHHEFQIIAL